MQQNQKYCLFHSMHSFFFFYKTYRLYYLLWNLTINSLVVTAALFLDWKKPFDVVQHKILFGKLKRSWALNLLKWNGSKRKASVGSFSKWSISLAHAVTMCHREVYLCHCSSVFTWKTSQHSQSRIQMYADDTVLYYSEKNNGGMSAGFNRVCGKSCFLVYN